MKDYDTTTQTVISPAGAYRCCLASVATEHIGNRVPAGTKSACEHCKEAFTLTEKPGQEKAVWQPDWAIEKGL